MNSVSDVAPVIIELGLKIDLCDLEEEEDVSSVNSANLSSNTDHSQVIGLDTN